MISRDMLENEANYLYEGTFSAPKEIMQYMHKNADSYDRYCSFIYQIDGEIVLRTWAFRDRHEFEYTEVERKTIGLAIRKNIYLTAMSGYRPVYKPQTHPCNNNWYGYYYSYFDAADFDKWFSEPEMGLCSTIVNIYRLFDIPKYQYCGFTGGCNLFRYLEFYNKEPLVEFFGKMGIKPGANYIRLAKKDKQFIRFLKDNVEEINHGFYNQTEVIWAYQHKCSFTEARNAAIHRRRALQATSHFHCIQKTKVDRVKLYDWIEENNIGAWNYADYFKAIYVLGLDLNDTKNLYPKNFKRMHDMRIAEYHSFVAEQNEKAKAELNEKFKQKAEIYKALELEGEKYCVVIPEGIKDLVLEGESLHHCVGKMGYDSKVAEGKSIIAFVRLNSKKNVPFVTVEFVLDRNIVSQVYGDHDSKPSKEVISFVDEWANKTRKQLKSITA